MSSPSVTIIVRTIGHPRLRRACDVDRGSLDLWLQRAWLEHLCGERDAALKSLGCARSLATDAASEARVASVAAGIGGN
jgi:hypothetical protein